MYEDSLQHYGILGMKWGVRRTPEQLGHRPVKPKTSIEKWKAKKIRAIDKVYNKTYRELDKAARENPNDKSITAYRKKVESQHKKDTSTITDMTYAQVRGAKQNEAAAAKERRNKAVASAGNAALWSARMALTLTRIGGMALAVDIFANAGNTLIKTLESPECREAIKSGAEAIGKAGNLSLQVLNITQKGISSNNDLYIPGADDLDELLRRAAAL